MSPLLQPASLRPETALPAGTPGRRPSPLPRAQLAELVAELSHDVPRWRAQVRHVPEHRWWTRLIHDDRVDAWLITWPGEESTDLHDHGGSAAALTVVEGVLEHVVASRGGGLSRETFSAGTLLSVAPGTVHDVRNPTSRPAVSIHAYSPPLERMTFYTRDAGGLRPVRTLLGDQPEMHDPYAGAV